MNGNYVLAVDTDKVPHTPLHPAAARKLLSSGMAAVYRRYPFTIIYKRAIPAPAPTLRLKIAPGSKTSGFALLDADRVVWAAELQHRGTAIKAALDKRRTVRRSRRNRKTRYRKPRFLNRTRPKGWLAPSLRHRVDNIMAWVSRLRRLAPVACLSVQSMSFDTQLLQDPEIAGVEYQQGELFGFELREYLLEKFDRTCVYCKRTEVPLQVNHIVPPQRGGTERASNLVTACRPCIEKKGNQTAEEFGYPNVQAQARRSLRDVAAINSTRWRIYLELLDTELPVESGSAALTKFNRTMKQDLPKARWIEAACVGDSTPVLHLRTQQPLYIKSVGRGMRRKCLMNAYGFPRAKARLAKRIGGFSTGDHVRLIQPRGKYAGTWESTLVGISRTGALSIKNPGGKMISAPYTRYTLIQRADGYAYPAPAKAAQAEATG